MATTCRTSDGDLLDRVATPDEPGRRLLADAAAELKKRRKTTPVVAPLAVEAVRLLEERVEALEAANAPPPAMARRDATSA